MWNFAFVGIEPIVASTQVRRLMRKYQLAATLAAQDWLTCLAWERPELVHRLPCQFNRQTSLQYWRLITNTKHSSVKLSPALQAAV